MYAFRALAGAVALAVLAPVLFVVALTGPWFTADAGQLVLWVAGAASIACVTGAVAQWREYEARRLWTQDRSVRS